MHKRKHASPKQYFAQRSKYILASGLAPDCWPRLRERAVIPPEIGDGIGHWIQCRIQEIEAKIRHHMHLQKSMEFVQWKLFHGSAVDSLKPVLRWLRSHKTSAIRSIDWDIHAAACESLPPPVIP